MVSDAHRKFSGATTSVAGKLTNLPPSLMYILKRYILNEPAADSIRGDGQPFRAD
jgi:hypothetical protein